MKRRTFFTTTSLAALSTAFLKASTPSTLEQWLAQHQNATGTVTLRPHQAVEKLSQLSNLIDTPLMSNGNKLNFQHLGTTHQLTLKLAA